jgi:hypothetical protein
VKGVFEAKRERREVNVSEGMRAVKRERREGSEGIRAVDRKG